MLKFYFLTYKKMANETLPTVDVKKVQSIRDWLTEKEKELLFDLLKEERDKAEELERKRIAEENKKLRQEAFVDAMLDQSKQGV